MTDTIDTLEYIKVSDARKNIGEHLDEAAKKGIRIALTKHGKPVAGIVPYADLETLEQADEIAFAEMDAEGVTEQLAGLSVNDPGHVFAAPTMGTTEPVGMECLPLVEDTADKITPFLTGQIAARMQDSGLALEPSVFMAIQDIVTRSIHDTFDGKIMPNLPRVQVTAMTVAPAASPPATARAIYGGRVGVFEPVESPKSMFVAPDPGALHPKPDG